MELFIEWIKDIVKEKGMHLSIDGKAIKSARDKVNGGNTPYIVSAFLSDIVSLSGNKFPENLTRDMFERIYLPRISKTFQHYYNHIVADKDKFINGINKYGFIIASLLKTKEHEKKGKKAGTDIK